MTGPRYSVPRGPYQHHPDSPKEAALRAIISERFKQKMDGVEPRKIPSVFGFPAYIGDLNTVGFLRDGSLGIRLFIPPEFVEDFYHYIPYLAGQIMSVTMEPIKVTLEDLRELDDA